MKILERDRKAFAELTALCVTVVQSDNEIESLEARLREIKETRVAATASIEEKSGGIGALIFAAMEKAQSEVAEGKEDPEPESSDSVEPGAVAPRRTRGRGRKAAEPQVEKPSQTEAAGVNHASEDHVQGAADSIEIISPEPASLPPVSEVKVQPAEIVEAEVVEASSVVNKPDASAESDDDIADEPPFIAAVPVESLPVRDSLEDDSDFLNNVVDAKVVEEKSEDFSSEPPRSSSGHHDNSFFSDVMGDIGAL